VRNCKPELLAKSILCWFSWQWSLFNDELCVHVCYSNRSRTKSRNKPALRAHVVELVDSEIGIGGACGDWAVVGIIVLEGAADTLYYCGLNASGPEGIRIQISTTPRHYGAIFFASRRFALLTVRFAHRDASLRAAAGCAADTPTRGQSGQATHR
jgi:hypothetical protein